MEFKIENTEVYGLENSLRSAGNPLRVFIDDFKMNEEIKFWNEKNKNFIKDFYNYQSNYGKLKGQDNIGSCYVCGSSENVQKNNKQGEGHYYCSKHNHQLVRYNKWFETTPKYTLRDDYVSICIPNNDKEIFISYSSLVDVFYNYPTSITNGGYVKLKNGELLHRFLMKNELLENELVVDHINHNTLDNRLENLRVCSKRQNCLNSSLNKNNTTNYIGVTWKKDKNKFKSYINVDGKQIHLGYFTDINEAIKARLLAEIKYFGNFAPQKHLMEQFSLERTEKEQSNHMLSEILKRYRLTNALASTPTGCGEDNFLNGIIVQFDLYAPLYMWKQIQRYHWMDFISSQSTMHRLVKFNIAEQCVKDTDEEVMYRVQELVDRYNNFVEGYKPIADDPEIKKIRESKWRTIVASLPCGFVLGATMTTNYRQLKTQFWQRYNHKLREWREYCAWILTLPHSELIVGENPPKIKL